MSVFVYFYICHFNQNGWKSIYFLTFFRSVCLILHTPPVLLRLASSDFPSVSINGRLFILELKQFHKSQSIFKRNGFLVDSLYVPTLHLSLRSLFAVIGLPLSRWNLQYLHTCSNAFDFVEHHQQTTVDRHLSPIWKCLNP